MCNYYSTTMEDIEKLSCKEELDISDVEHSTTDEHKDNEEKPKKKKRRRREIDMIKLSEEEDSEEEGSGKRLRPSPGPGSHSPAAHREPRTCVLKASQKRRPLSRLLEQLLRNLEKRDPHQFFAWPVNDTFAPNYSNVIRRPMDFSTIKQKIDDNEYRSLNCFISDFKLMCNNAMKYNKPGTVYHKAAKRLMHAGVRQLAPAKLRPLAEMLTYMYEIPIRELGFDIGKMDLHKVLKRGGGGACGGEGGSEAEAEPETGTGSVHAADGRKMAMEAQREMQRRRLAKKAFPRMDGEGKTTLCVVTAGAAGAAGETISGETKVPLPTVGRLVGTIAHGTGTGTLHAPREDRRNLSKAVKPLHYGPFASFAPSYDSTFATLTKDETHLVLHTLPFETGCNSHSLLRFSADSPWKHIYDMETMFPDTHATASTQASGADDELSKVKIDVEQLKSLSSLGIDMEFLTDIEEEVVASQRDLGLQPALSHTAELLARLEKEQHHRLSSPPPWHLSLVSRASSNERELSRLLSGCLRSMAARLPPGDLASLTALRQAMGVTLHHLDTPVAVEEVEEGELSAREGSDIDSRDSHDK